MKIETVVVGGLDVNCYIVSCDTQPDCLIIDPGDEFERIHEVTEAKGLSPKYIVFTHAHYDHVCAARELRDTSKASIVMHGDDLDVYAQTRDMCIKWGYEDDDFPSPDILVSDESLLPLGDIVFRVIHTPGHTPGSICLYSEGCLFTGDTLFASSVGRTDLHGGNQESLLSSLKKIMSLPPDTVILPGHGERSTVSAEKKVNPFLQFRT